MKNIMLSIRPEWLQKILSGQKTVELRLSRPNLTPPFMVFLYCSCKGTKKPGEILEIHSGGKIYKANGLVVMMPRPSSSVDTSWKIESLTPF